MQEEEKGEGQRKEGGKKIECRRRKKRVRQIRMKDGAKERRGIGRDRGWEVQRSINSGADANSDRAGIQDMLMWCSGFYQCHHSNATNRNNRPLLRDSRAVEDCICMIWASQRKAIDIPTGWQLGVYPWRHSLRMSGGRSLLSPW